MAARLTCSVGAGSGTAPAAGIGTACPGCSWAIGVTEGDHYGLRLVVRPRAGARILDADHLRGRVDHRRDVLPAPVDRGAVEFLTCWPPCLTISLNMSSVGGSPSVGAIFALAVVTGTVGPASTHVPLAAEAGLTR